MRQLTRGYSPMADLTLALKRFEHKVQRAEVIVSNVEALWQTAPRGTDVRKRIGEDELCSLYEMTFLSIFGHWENFVEDCLVRLIRGQGTPTYSPVVPAGRAASLAEARTRLLDGRRWLLWHDPQRNLIRVRQHVTGSPLEQALDASGSQLEDYAAIRHAVAHRSPDALDNFNAAAMKLTGVEHGSPGRLLRSQDHSDPLNPVRWIRVISGDFRSIGAAAVD